MKTTAHKRKGKPGFSTFLLVLSTGIIALALTIYTYRHAIASQQVTARANLRIDYSEKEDAILRALVAITPNRAIRAMQGDAQENSPKRDSLRWQNIFRDAVGMANARTSVSSDLETALGLENLIVANSGDSVLTNMDAIFDHVRDDPSSSNRSNYISSGLNRDLEDFFPPPLQTADLAVARDDSRYPLITTSKSYGNLAASGVGLSVLEYPQHNLLKYPQISFGYASPGDDFVAKRNWWAFRMNLSEHDDDKTGMRAMDREFVLSIYEIPSQLSISASAFMSLGSFGNGESWDNVSIAGGVFAGKAEVVGDTSLAALASRRGMNLSNTATIGGESFSDSPFKPGVRETYRLTEGDFFPISQASESGRVAFIPINRGVEFFDRFAHIPESDTVSPTTWSDYSVGALQCAMQLDIVDCVSSIDKTPTKYRFTYMKGGVREEMEIDLINGAKDGPGKGYLYACAEGATYDFGDAVVDLVYTGADGVPYYQYQATGLVTFNDGFFGAPNDELPRYGYFKPSMPFEHRTLDTGKVCIAVYPERFESFLDAINADDTSLNHSLVINVDYHNDVTNDDGNPDLDKPSIPCTDLDYGVIIEECEDFTSFPKGFSLVTNLRTYIGGDFNIVEGTPPAGYTPGGAYYPPVSLFAPEKRYGINADPRSIRFSGRMGSLADEDGGAIRPLDSTGASGSSFDADKITMNLSPIAHPADLPPVFMMNWLVTLEEVRSEYVDY